MQERSPGEGAGDVGGKFVQQKKGVDPDVAFRMILRWLLFPFIFSISGRTSCRSPDSSSSSKARLAWPSVSDFGEFFTNALAADLMDFRCPTLDGEHRLRLDGVAEACSEAYGTQHSQLVFAEAALGVADGTNDFRVGIGAATHVVEHTIIVQGIEQESINSEVAALDIFLGGLAETDFVGMSAVGV